MSGRVDLLEWGSRLRLGTLKKSKRVIALKVAGFRASRTEEEGD
jgi:tRNA G26 N,N-dimethylase Trm1